MSNPDRWFLQIKGEKCGKKYEMSVVHKSNIHGQKSWGCFDAQKLLVLHNGGPCDWPVCAEVWDAAVNAGSALAKKLSELGVDEYIIHSGEPTNRP